MTSLSQTFIKMGDTGSATQFSKTGTPHTDWQSFKVPFNSAFDPDPFPDKADIRFIITPSDRYTSQFTTSLDAAFPVGGIRAPVSPPFDFFEIDARNSAAAGQASFFWLAIAENFTRPRTSVLDNIPLNQTFIGQPAYFSGTGDQQAFPIFHDPANPAGQPNVQMQLRQNGLYSFRNTFGTTAFPTPPSGSNKPLVFATANNIGSGISPYYSAHNSAAVGLVVDSGFSSEITPSGFNLMALNVDTSGTCGFNWVALQQRARDTLPNGTAPPADLMVDTGVFDGGIQVSNHVYFNNMGTAGDWFSAEIQFSAPFSVEPAVLVSNQFVQGWVNTAGQQSSCAPVAVVQNVTRFGFTLSARNTDNNRLGGACRFYWAAFGTA